MAVKNMKRDPWPRILEKDVRIEDFARGGLWGKISLMEIRRLTAPLTIDYGSYIGG